MVLRYPGTAPDYAAHAYLAAKAALAPPAASRKPAAAAAWAAPTAPAKNWLRPVDGVRERRHGGGGPVNGL